MQSLSIIRGEGVKFPANTKHLYNIYTTSTQRLRRWHNIINVIQIFCVFWVITTIVNHEGLALSYSELRRYQHDLTSFTAQHNKEIISLPRQFDPGQFTSGAINNWDYEGANVSEHDIVTVLFQDKHQLANPGYLALTSYMDHNLSRKH